METTMAQRKGGLDGSIIYLGGRGGELWITKREAEGIKEKLLSAENDGTRNLSKEF